MINCSVAASEQAKANKEYVCTLRINPVDGTVKAAETKSIKKADKTTEEKTEDKKDDGEAAPTDDSAPAAPAEPSEPEAPATKAKAVKGLRT
ncbi:hypothetical protein D3C87_1455440 [compost metagenome]